jgi:hypothetical protein
MKTLASLSLDLDNQWSYMKIHGDPGWEKYPSYFDVFLPHVLDLLDRWSLKITFFIVGLDAAMDKNREYLKEITNRGHEVGNHSYNHESWLHKYSTCELKKEVLNADRQISRITGMQPVGFRGPGFSWSKNLLEVLAECNYRFDASVLPTYIGPLARRYYFWKSDLNPDEKKERNELFGSTKNGFQPVKPYTWQLCSGQKITEIPVTTIPIVKTPFHLSYLLYLSRFSTFLMRFYLSMAIYLCKATGISPSYLLHPLDLIGGDMLKSLSFFPGMDLSSNNKIRVFNLVIGDLSRHFKLTSMSIHADYILKNENLKTVRVTRAV